MATADKLVYLGGTKDLLREAINAAGGSLTELDPFRDYADPILWGWLVDAQGGLDLDYVNERYRVYDPAYNALVEKPWADIVNNYSAPAGRTYFDSSGVLQTAAANTPIRAYDPATGEFLGNQIWGSYSNLLRHSEDFTNAVWGTSVDTAVVTPNAAIAPDGTNSADLIEFGTPGSNRFQTYAVTAGLPYAFSVFLKSPPGYGTQQLDIGAIAPGVYSRQTITEDWKRFSITTTPASSPRYPMIQSVSASQQVHAWGASLRQSQLAGPYVATVGSAVTIAAENQIIDGSVFSDMWNPVSGTLFIECSGSIDAVALKAAGVEVIVDSASNKKYAVAYTSDPSATSLIIGANLNGYIRRITYFRKELSASLIARLIA